MGQAVHDKIEELKQRQAKQPGEVERSVSAGFFEALPKAMFLLLPIFALLSRLFFRRSDAFYADHLVLSLHEHAFAMVALTVGALVPNGWATGPANLAIAVHLYAALRTVFQQGRLRTALKCAGLLFCYSIALALVIGAAGLFSLARI